MQLSRPGTLASALLCVLLVWAPLPFASVQPWARLLLAVLGLVLAGLCVLDREVRQFPRSAVPGALALGLLGGWAVVQSIALPGGLVSTLSPHSGALRSQTAELLDTGGDPTSWPLSLAPTVSLDLGLWLLSLAAVGLAAAVVARQRPQRRWLAGALLSGGLFQALYGSRRWAAKASDIWGTEVPGSGQRLRGTFVNSDHLAFYLELILAVNTGWLLWALGRQRRERRLEQRILLVAPPLMSWLILFTCLAFTGSRAGLVAALAATAVQGVLVAVAKRRRRWLPIGFVLGVAGIVTVALLGLRAGFGRWLATSSYELTWNVRLQVYEATRKLAAEFPTTGVGMGAFSDAFPLVQPDDVSGRWTHAHNDWLELLVSAGWPVTILFVLLLSLFCLGLVRRLGTQHRSEDRTAVIAALGALVAAGLHSCLDFGLAMPANALTLVVLCGAAAGTPKRYRSDSGEDLVEPPASRPSLRSRQDL